MGGLEFLKNLQKLLDLRGILHDVDPVCDLEDLEVGQVGCLSEKLLDSWPAVQPLILKDRSVLEALLERLEGKKVLSLTQFYSVDFSQSRIRVKKVRFKQTHNQGLRGLLLTVSWDLHAYYDTLEGVLSTLWFLRERKR